MLNSLLIISDKFQCEKRLSINQKLIGNLVVILDLKFQAPNH